MTKPHEETWHLDHLVVANQDGKSRFGSGSPVGVDFAEDVATLRLAAQAPAMARLLLELQWSASRDGQDGACCPDCGGLPPSSHAPRCELVAVLRAAGVLP